MCLQSPEGTAQSAYAAIVGTTRHHSDHLTKPTHSGQVTSALVTSKLIKLDNRLAGTPRANLDKPARPDAQQQAPIDHVQSNRQPYKKASTIAIPHSVAYTPHTPA
jgi:hypothetical protein